MKYLLVIPLMLALVGCNDVNPPPPNTPEMSSDRQGYIVKSVRGGNSYSDIGVWTDPTTGCQYFTGEVHLGIMMTARIGADGRPICEKEKSTDYQEYVKMKKRFEPDGK